jgi:hypothetical protein
MCSRDSSYCTCLQKHMRLYMHVNIGVEVSFGSSCVACGHSGWQQLCRRWWWVAACTLALSKTQPERQHTATCLAELPMLPGGLMLCTFQLCTVLLNNNTTQHTMPSPPPTGLSLTASQRAPIRAMTASATALTLSSSAPHLRVSASSLGRVTTLHLSPVASPRPRALVRKRFHSSWTFW